MRNKPRKINIALRTKPRKITIACGNSRPQHELFEEIDECLFLVGECAKRWVKKGFFHQAGIFEQVACCAMYIGMEKVPQKRKKKKA